MTYIMTEREDKVYKAKLAEQAERYDGKYYFFAHLFPNEKFVYFVICLNKTFF